MHHVWYSPLSDTLFKIKSFIEHETLTAADKHTHTRVCKTLTEHKIYDIATFINFLSDHFSFEWH